VSSTGDLHRAAPRRAVLGALGLERLERAGRRPRHPLHSRRRRRVERGEADRELERRRGGVVGDPFDEPDRVRLGRFDRAHRQAQVHRPAAPDKRRQSPRADGEAVTRTGEADARAGRGDAQVGRDREVRAAADGRAVDRGDDDRVGRRHPPVQLVQQVADRGALGVLEGQVGAGAERVPRCRAEQDHRLVRRGEGVEQRLEHRAVERVAPLGTIEAQAEHPRRRPVATQRLAAGRLLHGTGITSRAVCSENRDLGGDDGPGQHRRRSGAARRGGR
jgi:hypothetical protein